MGGEALSERSTGGCAEGAYGAEPKMDPRIVEILERWGFAWGGHWSTPDGMHFEVERFVRVD